MPNFSENQVHEFIYSKGLEELINDNRNFENEKLKKHSSENFEFWKVVKQKALSKIFCLHNLVKHGDLIASKLLLPTDRTRPMELDMLGMHEDGLFILELKVNRSAERNAFSELLAYSNYIASIFPGSGHLDITNVLVANVDAKITRQAFLYDLLITGRNIIVYTPIFFNNVLESLKLELFLPLDEDFKSFTNELLSHDSMACTVVSFEDIEGWIDSKEESGQLNQWTVEHLEKLAHYTSQLMEAEGLHGFCFIRKPHEEIPRHYRNSIFICALNPFSQPVPEILESITSQLDKEDVDDFIEFPKIGFDGRLIRIAERALIDCLGNEVDNELSTPLWSGIVTSSIEVVHSHNFGFHPCGLFREAYVSFLDRIYQENQDNPELRQDVSRLKVNEIGNWLRAWLFMEACGFTDYKDEYK